MKKQLLLATALFGTFFFASAQNVTENFNSLTVGNLGTDLTGATAGQGGWYTQGGTAFANDNFQIIAGDENHGNVLEVTGAAGTTGTASFLWRADMLDWDGRTAGNDVVSVSFDFYTGVIDAAAGNAFGSVIYNDDYTLNLNGFLYDQRTLTPLGFAYVLLEGDTEPDNNIFALSNTALPENTWVTVTMTYDQVSGELTWEGADAEGNALFSLTGSGAAPEATPFEADLTVLNVYTTNGGASSTTFDNFSVSLIGATAGVDENTLANLSVYPNPANDVVNVSVDALVSNVAIVDLNGRTVKTAKFDGVSNASVNVSDLASGVYMMTVSSDKGTSTKKIVKN